MNSLTTVGGTVVDEEEVGNYGSTAARHHPENKPLPPRHVGLNRSGSASRDKGRAINPHPAVRRVKSVDDANRHGDTSSADSSGDSIDTPIQSSTLNASARRTLPKVSLGRHHSAPVPEHSTPPAPRTSSRSSPRAMTKTFSWADPDSNKPAMISIASTEPTMRVTGQHSPSVLSKTSTLTDTIFLPKSDGNGIIPSSSRIVNSHDKQAILSRLHILSNTEPYVSSAYFQRIFAQGIANVHAEKSNNGLRTTEDALRMCFDVNDDMVSVIAATDVALKEADAGRKLALEEEKQDAERRQSANRMPVSFEVGYEAEPKAGRLMDHHQIAKPWATPPTPRSSSMGSPRSSNKRYAGRNQSFQSSSPTDLSGYTNKEKNSSKNKERYYNEQEDSMNIATSSPSTHHMHRHSFPPTEHYMGGDHAKTLTSNPMDALSLALPPTPQTPGKISFAPSQSPYPPEEYVTMSSSVYYDRTTPSPSYITPPNIAQSPQEIEESNRKEKARAQVQQYLEQIDHRIRTVKGGQTDVKRVQSTGNNVMINDVQQHNVVRLWDSFDGVTSSTVITPPRTKLRKQLLLPSLLSPDHADAAFGEPQTNPSSVFRIDDNVPAREDEAILDNVHTSSSKNQTPQLLVVDSLTDSETHQLSPSDDDNVAQQVRAVEKSLGLKSISEYKALLQSKTTEMEGLKKRYENQVAQSEADSKLHDADVKQFKSAMKEAETAALALEDTIELLEKASHDKDELIARLESRVKELEVELEQHAKNKFETRAKHQQVVDILNEGISKMNTAVNAKDASINDYQSKMEKLENNLTKTMEQFSTSQAELKHVQSAVASQNKTLQSTQSELESTKQTLESSVEHYRNEISTSLDTTTQLMDLMAKEKDGLIHSLQAKIAMMECSLGELQDEKEVGTDKYVGMERELNGKIQRLAVELREKGLTIIGIQQENKQREFRRELTREFKENKKKEAEMEMEKTKKAAAEKEAEEKAAMEAAVAKAAEKKALENKAANKKAADKKAVEMKAAEVKAAEKKELEQKLRRELEDLERELRKELEEELNKAAKEMATEKRELEKKLEKEKRKASEKKQRTRNSNRDAKGNHGRRKTMKESKMKVRSENGRASNRNQRISHYVHRHIPNHEERHQMKQPYHKQHHRSRHEKMPSPEGHYYESADTTHDQNYLQHQPHQDRYDDETRDEDNMIMVMEGNGNIHPADYYH